jgi:hypothetical protein
MKETDRKLRGQKAAMVHGTTTVFANGAAFLRPCLDFRLEHKLQTAVGRRRLAPPQFLSITDGIGGDRAPASS